MKSTFLILASTLLLQTALAHAQDTNNHFRILNITSSGSACEPGSVAVNISDDQEAFTLSFQNFVAEIGPNAPRSERHKTCRLNVATQHDPGWEFAVIGLSQRGGVYLDPGVFAVQSLRYGLAPRLEQHIQVYKGPKDEDYVTSQQINFSRLNWSGCSRRQSYLNTYQVEATVDLLSLKPKAQGLFTVDSIDGEVKQEFDILWRRCDSRANRFVALCKTGGSGSSEPSLFAKAQGLRPQEVLLRAQRKLERRCAEASGADALEACSKIQRSCELTPFKG